MARPARRVGNASSPAGGAYVMLTSCMSCPRPVCSFAAGCKLARLWFSWAGLRWGMWAAGRVPPRAAHSCITAGFLCQILPPGWPRLHPLRQRCLERTDVLPICGIRCLAGTALCRRCIVCAAACSGRVVPATHPASSYPVQTVQGHLYTCMQRFVRHSAGFAACACDSQFVTNRPCTLLPQGLECHSHDLKDQVDPS